MTATTATTTNKRAVFRIAIPSRNTKRVHKPIRQRITNVKNKVKKFMRKRFQSLTMRLSAAPLWVRYLTAITILVGVWFTCFFVSYFFAYMLIALPLMSLGYVNTGILLAELTGLIVGLTSALLLTEMVEPALYF